MNIKERLKYLKEYFKYLFAQPNERGYCNWITRLRCRMNGHPKGVKWYNPNGTVPDMRCTTCNDDLG